MPGPGLPALTGGNFVRVYERGTNRIGASRLFELSNLLDEPLSFVFNDMPPEVSSKRNGRPAGISEVQGAVYKADPLAKRETLDLVRAYYRIMSDKVRKRVFELTKIIAKAGDTE